MARGCHYTKLSLSSALLLFFSGRCIFVIAPFFLSFRFRFVMFSVALVGAFFVDVPLMFFCPADHVPDWHIVTAQSGPPVILVNLCHSH